MIKSIYDFNVMMCKIYIYQDKDNQFIIQSKKQINILIHNVLWTNLQ